uniref:Complement component 1 Q subcomponent-binding protein, mitochondrial n=1 Tax=Pavo cristatus TaxID=9049 RepID=A0A8C9F4K7_PAVCR
VSGGWELEVHGTEARLVRKVAGEKITVTFNINNSIPPAVDDEAPEEQKPDEQEEPDITSTPNFVVEVIKDDTKQTLVLDCHYPEDEVSRGCFLLSAVVSFSTSAKVLPAALYSQLQDETADGTL